MLFPSLHDRGYPSPWVIPNAVRMTAELDDWDVQQPDTKPVSLPAIGPLHEAVTSAASQPPSAAEPIRGEPLASLAVNALRIRHELAAAKAPGFVDRHTATGARLEPVPLGILARGAAVLRVQGALENAASVAGLFIGTAAMIAEMPRKTCPNGGVSESTPSAGDHSPPPGPIRSISTDRADRVAQGHQRITERNKQPVRKGKQNVQR